MAKRKRATVHPEDLRDDLDAVVARLNRLDAVLNQIELRLEPLKALPEGLAASRELALEAVAQAQDALEHARLSREHETRLNNLTLAVAEGIQHVERAEARIRATVGRARAELRAAGIESAGVEAEAASLQLVDGEGSGGGSVPPVSQPLAESVPIDDRLPSAIPGMTRGDLRRFRGA